jgi:hypothetical protein
MIQLGLMLLILPTRSVPARTRRTPAAALAADKSTLVMMACACGGRRIANHSVPGIFMSSV